MRRISIVQLAVSASMSALSSGVVFIGVSQARAVDCDAAISDVLQDISGRGAMIARVEKRDASNYSGNPFPGSRHLVVALEGSGQPSVNPKRAAQAAENIMMSPKLNYSWAQSIVEACPDIAIVGFGMWQTGWQNMFYRFRDGRVRPKVCISDMTSTTWGVGWCD